MSNPSSVYSQSLSSLSTSTTGTSFTSLDSKPEDMPRSESNLAPPVAAPLLSTSPAPVTEPAPPIRASSSSSSSSSQHLTGAASPKLPNFSSPGPSRSATLPSSGSRAARLSAGGTLSPYPPIEPRDLCPPQTTASSSSPNGHADLFVDLRPYTAYVSAEGRLRSAVSVCVPSTLLRRDNFTIQRIAESLAFSSSRERILDFSSYSRVIVYDNDSTVCTRDSSPVFFLSKLDREGYTGQLRWLRGGFQAIVSQAPELLETGPFSEESSSGLKTSRDSKEHGKSSSDVPILQCHDLPQSAFQLRSTEFYNSGDIFTQRSQSTPGVSSPVVPRSRAHPAPGSLSLNSRASQRVAVDPFFSNIRQNIEGLSRGSLLSNLSPIEIPPSLTSAEIVQYLPSYLAALVQTPATSRARRLALEYYNVEEKEKKRLQDVYSWTGDGNGEKFLDYLSISAGLEKGHLNRHPNIYPYEHTRCRIEAPDDYINASMIPNKKSNKRYIASQGPLNATFGHFWQLVWEQDVRVVVMLTRLREGGGEKCGHYFADGTYGDYTVREINKLVIDGSTREEDDMMDGFGFGQALASEKGCDIVRKTLEVSRTGHPPRTIEHFQLTSWPDFDVAPNEAVVLEVIDRANAANQTSDSPILVHCSAGVGRTGCYILLDMLLDEAKRRMDAGYDSLTPSRERKEGQVLKDTARQSDENVVPKLLDEIRELRMNMIATLSQYIFVHLVLLRGMTRLIRKRHGMASS